MRSTYVYVIDRVYMIRVKCENNATTTQRLTSIVSALFPKGQKVVMPRDTPLNIYVKMLQFIGETITLYLVVLCSVVIVFQYITSSFCGVSESASFHFTQSVLSFKEKLEKKTAESFWIAYVCLLQLERN